ncbi:MAG: hypothetical protein M1816_002888 [Peltula sp. TS41687]|nr:MAG: hypothetical protein M1816_002888 [Peltula sp. TS41687]
MKFTSTTSVCILVSAAQHLAGFAAASPVAQLPTEHLPPLLQQGSLDGNGTPAPAVQVPTEDQPSFPQQDSTDLNGAPAPAVQVPTEDQPSYPPQQSVDVNVNPVQTPAPPLDQLGTLDASGIPAPRRPDYPSYIRIPYRGDGKELPQPPAGLTLKAVAVGSGEQQYLCKRHKPLPYGAMAELYDAYDMFASAVNPKVFTDSLLEHRGALPMKHIGRHYFDARGAPAFELDGQGFFRGVKTAVLNAPKSPNNHQRGAIQWIQLKDKGGSQGFKMAYRVATAGGTAPKACSRNNRVDNIPYAALYYFYG